MLKPSLQVHNENGVLVAEFWDCLRLDPAPIQDLRKKYELHITGKGRPEVVIDLLGVAFAGSSSLSHFVTLLKQVRQRGGRILFCNVDPTVRETFRVSRLAPMFTFVADRAEALAAVLNPQDDAGSVGYAGVRGSAVFPGLDSASESPGATLLRRSHREKLSGGEPIP